MNLDINDAAISSLSHVIGNDNVKRSIQVALDYAQTEGTAFPSTMLLGGPGLGKSSIAAVIANEMAADFKEVIGQSLNSVADLNHLLLSATDKSVVHLDEAHSLSVPLQTSLLLAMEKKTVYVNVGGQSPQPIKLANFSLLLSTTEEYDLLPPLRDRMRLVLRLSYSSVPELAKVVLHRSRALGWDVHEAALPLIGATCQRHASPCLAIAPIVSPSLPCPRRHDDHGEAPGDGLRVGSTRPPGPRRHRAGIPSHPGGWTRPTERYCQPHRAAGADRPAGDGSRLVRLGLVGKDRTGLRELTAKGREHVSGLRRETG